MTQLFTVRNARRARTERLAELAEAKQDRLADIERIGRDYLNGLEREAASHLLTALEQGTSFLHANRTAEEIIAGFAAAKFAVWAGVNDTRVVASDAVVSRAEIVLQSWSAIADLPLLGFRVDDASFGRLADKLGTSIQQFILAVRINQRGGFAEESVPTDADATEISSTPI
jgi:hypothetical protein